MRTRLLLSLCMVLSLTALAFPWNNQAQEGAPVPEPIPAEKWPEAPAEMVGSYISAVKATPRYQFAEALKREKIEAEIEKWKPGVGIDVSVEWESYLLSHLQDESRQVEIPGKGTWNIEMREVYDSGSTREFLVLSDRSGDVERGYRISVASLKELDMTFVSGIVIRSPLNRVVGRYSVQNEQLSTVVASLCKEAAAGRGNVDYVVRSDPGAQVQLSMQMGGRTVFDCLMLAARSVGWDVYVNPDLENHDERPATRAYDSNARWEDARELWINREILNMRDKIQPPVATPLDALRECFQREVKSALNDHYVIMLRPAKKD